MLFECMHRNCNLIPLMKHNLLFTRQHYILMREHVCKESDIPVTTSIINQWKLIDHVRVSNKKSKTDFEVWQKVLKEERSKTQDAFVRDETIQYNYGGFNENIGKKNNTCMWVLSNYIYSSDFSLRWKFHHTAKYLNCNVATILNTNIYFNKCFVCYVMMCRFC